MGDRSNVITKSEALTMNIITTCTLSDDGTGAVYRIVAERKENSEILLIGRGRKVTFQGSL